ncbi:MAG: hypothetical protein OEV40_15080 [Acidimicrobiia bacterium]|nr:hypothetical protein [Acidimicrobiia bacterium]
MTAVVALLLVNGTLGAADTLWYHEWKVRLPARPGPFRLELALHAGRDAVYVVVYGSLGWVAWTGRATPVLVGLLGAEIVITLVDFVVEDRLRPAIGGMAAGERMLHSAMAIVYGAMLAQLVPILAGWWGADGGLQPHTDQAPPLWMAVIASVLAAGIALSGLRDAVAAARTLRPRGRRGPSRPPAPRR